MGNHNSSTSQLSNAFILLFSGSEQSFSVIISIKEWSKAVTPKVKVI